MLKIFNLVNAGGGVHNLLMNVNNHIIYTGYIGSQHITILKLG